jgi:hypothetical protein
MTTTIMMTPAPASGSTQEARDSYRAARERTKRCDEIKSGLLGAHPGNVPYHSANGPQSQGNPSNPRTIPGPQY